MFLDPEELRAFLIAAARARESVTYSEALQSQGYAFTRPKMRALCSVLGDIDAEGRGRDEPELAVLVVRQSDGLPGQGWWTMGGADGYSGPWEGPEARRHVTCLQNRAFDYWGGA
ncbi:ribose-phosphate pyrophosphokinase [Pacificimonas sp. WHA3]|uniref:Ribose-phosphate pyrophosphokinase n=1 Tax=Pacificimonas pallii TaxID=2827236 RepID=A0ABS6SFD0_9SPHN|nr:ribose-phosphate pyrophosphokinase [Pacificimonas pallii]MBV7256646.1 ribose-phosphate pyrophosphokinase [Pacificimonas pallii]